MQQVSKIAWPEFEHGSRNSPADRTTSLPMARLTRQESCLKSFIFICMLRMGKIIRLLSSVFAARFRWLRGFLFCSIPRVFSLAFCSFTTDSAP